MKRINDIKIQRTVSVVGSFEESDALDREFRRAQPMDVRLEMIELLRQINYGYDPDTARLQRVLEVVEYIPR